MRSLSTRELHLVIIAFLLVFAILHQYLLNHHRTLQNTLLDLQSRNSLLEKRIVTSRSREDSRLRRSSVTMDDLSDSLLSFDNLVVTQRDNTIAIDFSGTSAQVWHMLQTLQEIPYITPGLFEFHITGRGIEGRLELHYNPHDS